MFSNQAGLTRKCTHFSKARFRISGIITLSLGSFFQRGTKFLFLSSWSIFSFLDGYAESFPSLAANPCSSIQEMITFDVYVSEQATIEQVSIVEEFATVTTDNMVYTTTFGFIYPFTSSPSVTSTNNGPIVRNLLTRPFGMTFDGSGNLYVANANPSPSPCSIIKYSATGADEGSLSNISANVDAPAGLAYDSANNYLYVCDVVNNVVVRFDISGTTASNPTTIGTGIFNSPYGIVLDSSGNAYVTNYLGNTVSKISGTSVTANFITTGLNNPTGITFDAVGNIYVCNFGGVQGTISKFSSTGTSLGTFSARVSNPIGLTYVDNALFVASATGTKISKFTTAGRFLGTVGAFSSYRLVGGYDETGLPPKNNLPAWLAAGPNGKLYASSQSANIVAQFDAPTGAFYGLAAGVGYYGYAGVAVDSSNNLYAADFYGNAIHVFSLNGSSPFAHCALLNSPALNGPYGVAIDPRSGNLYVANYFSNTISAFSSNGNCSFNDLGIVGQTQGKNPIGIAIRPSDGFIFVVSANSNIIEVFPPRGGPSSRYATVADQGCSGITFDAANNLYVTTRTTNQVIKYSAFGSVPVVVQNTNLNAPTGLFYSPIPTSTPLPDLSNYLFVANANSNDITIFASEESYTASSLSGCAIEDPQSNLNPTISTASAPRGMAFTNVQVSNTTPTP